MTVVVYECDTCKREVYRKQNTAGIDVVGRCVITNGCKGKLLQIEVKPAHAVGHSTTPVIGLQDWTPRKILYTHTQAFAKKQWVITHDMNGIPIVNVFTYKQNSTDLIPVTPVSIEPTSGNVTTITFATATAGVAQLLMRSSVTDQAITTLKPRVVENEYTADHFVLSESLYMTNGPEAYGEFTVATRIATRDNPTFGFDPYQEIRIQPVYLSPSTLEHMPNLPQLVFRAINNTPVDTASSPWAGTTKVVVAGAQYVVRSVNIHYPSGTLPTLGIPEGAPVFFNIVDAAGNIVRTLQKGEMLALLADSPFLVVDKIFDKYVDLSQITEASAPKQLVYNNLNWRFNPSLLTKTYPNIITL